MDAMARYSSSGDPFSDKDWCLASGNEGAAVCDCACSLTPFLLITAPCKSTLQAKYAAKLKRPA